VAQKKHTTVILTETAQAVKEDLAPVFGLKNILSAGLFLLSDLSTEEQKQAIIKANSENIEKAQGEAKTLRSVFKNIVERAKKQKNNQIEIPGTIIQLTPDDQKAWEKLQELLGPEPAKQKKRKAKES